MSGPSAHASPKRPEGPEAHRELLERWKAEKESIEVLLASRIPEIDLDRRLADANRRKVADALPEGAVLVEFVRVRIFDFKAIPAQGQSLWKPAHYLAFVMTAREPENIRMIDLGDANVIDAMISDFRIAIKADKPGARVGAVGGARGPRVDIGPKLREALFDPIKKGLDERKRLLLARDSKIYLLPFGVLPADDSEGTEH